MVSNDPENRAVLAILITDKPVKKTAYQVKGVFMRHYPDLDIIPMLNGKYRDRYLYPRVQVKVLNEHCLLYTSPSPRDLSTSRMPSSA